MFEEVENTTPRSSESGTHVDSIRKLYEVISSSENITTDVKDESERIKRKPQLISRDRQTQSFTKESIQIEDNQNHVKQNDQKEDFEIQRNSGEYNKNLRKIEGQILFFSIIGEIAYFGNIKSLNNKIFRDPMDLIKRFR